MATKNLYSILSAIIGGFLLLQMGFSQAATDSPEKIIAETQKKADVPVLFPRELPAGKTSYFINNDFSAIANGINYTINIDSSKDCNGAHYCNIGSIRAERGAKVQISTDRNNKKITVPVVLSQRMQGYYTPGHAMGSYFPANIQWHYQDILYTISWNAGPETTPANLQKSLINMANSAINGNKK